MQRNVAPMLASFSSTMTLNCMDNTKSGSAANLVLLTVVVVVVVVVLSRGLTICKDRTRRHRHRHTVASDQNATTTTGLFACFRVCIYNRVVHNI